MPTAISTQHPPGPPSAHADDARVLDLAKIARLAFSDLPATTARSMLRDTAAMDYIRAHGHRRPDDRVTLDRDGARQLRAHLDPDWPRPAPPEVYARRHVHMRTDIAARRMSLAGTDARLAVDCEEFALLRSASMLVGSPSSPPWPSTAEELAGAISQRLTPATGQHSARQDPAQALKDLTSTAPSALAHLLGAADSHTLELMLAHTWFGYARSVAAVWHEPDSPDFGFAVSTILASLPDDPTHPQACDDLRAVLESVRAR